MLQPEYTIRVQLGSGRADLLGKLGQGEGRDATSLAGHLDGAGYEPDFLLQSKRRYAMVLAMVEAAERDGWAPTVWDTAAKIGRLMERSERIMGVSLNRKIAARF